MPVVLDLPAAFSPLCATLAMRNLVGFQPSRLGESLAAPGPHTPKGPFAGVDKLVSNESTGGRAAVLAGPPLASKRLLAGVCKPMSGECIEARGTMRAPLGYKLTLERLFARVDAGVCLQVSRLRERLRATLPIARVRLLTGVGPHVPFEMTIAPEFKRATLPGARHWPFARMGPHVRLEVPRLRERFFAATPHTVRATPGARERSGASVHQGVVFQRP